MVASYNIHGCVGTDGRYEPERIARVLAEISADVVALQEVDAGYHAAAGVDQFRFLADALGMEHVEGVTLRRGDARYGNAILSRLPLHASHDVDLSVAGREPRRAIDAATRISGRSVRFVATHLGLRRSERRQQARTLARHLATHDGEPLVLLGDMNEWWRNAALRFLDEVVGPSQRLPSFPSRRPLFPLDRIWAHPSDSLRAIEVHRSGLAAVASDHLPVRAELVVSPGVARTGATTGH